jgi:orotate phosphoribosyltransferase
MHADRAELVRFLQRDALKLGRFTLSSGKTSHYYVDGRLVTLSASGAEAVARGVHAILDEFPEVQAVGGLTMGADPIVGATLALAPAKGRTDLRGFLVRKEAKAHGAGRRVEGPIAEGLIVAIVDDVATTGASSIQAAEAIEELGGRVAVVIVVLDRLEGASEAIIARGYPFRALTTIRDLGVEPAQA